MEWVPNFIIQCSIYLQAVEKTLYNWIKKIMYDQTRIYQLLKMDGHFNLSPV